MVTLADILSKGRPDYSGGFMMRLRDYNRFCRRMKSDEVKFMENLKRQVSVKHQMKFPIRKLD